MSTRSHAALVVCIVAATVTLAGCGQRGPLYLPKDAAAKNRATLPEFVTPSMPGSPNDAAPAPAAAASAPGAAK